MGELLLYIFVVAMIAMVSYLFFWIIIVSAFIDVEKHGKDKVSKWSLTIGMVYCAIFMMIGLFNYINVF